MADDNQQYQDDNEKVAGYFDDILSPLNKAGVDPDEARVDRDGTMAKVMGPAYPGGANYPSRPPEGQSNPTVAPSDDPNPKPTQEQKPWADYTRQGLEGQMRATKAGEDAISKYSGMPADDPALKGLEEKRAQSAEHIDPRAQQYRPSLGTRVMRGVKAVATGGLPGLALADYSAPNRQYGYDKAEQAENVASIDQQITQARKNYEDATARFKGIAGEQQKVAGGYKDVVSGATAQEGTENKQELQDAQARERDARAELEKTKAGAEPTTETGLASAFGDAKARGDKMAMAKYSTAIQLLKSMKHAGRDTSASDLAKAIQVAEFGEREFDKINSTKEAERKGRYAELDKNVTLKYNQQAMANERAKVDQELEQKYQQRMDDVKAKADDMLGLTKNGSKLTDADKARTANKNAKNQPKRLDQSNPQDVAKAREYLQKAGGDKDKARELARKDNYSF